MKLRRTFCQIYTSIRKALLKQNKHNQKKEKNSKWRKYKHTMLACHQNDNVSMNWSSKSCFMNWPEIRTSTRNKNSYFFISNPCPCIFTVISTTFRFLNTISTLQEIRCYNTWSKWRMGFERNPFWTLIAWWWWGRRKGRRG